MGPLREDDSLPQSPAFATSSAFAPAISSTRPDHSTLDLYSASTTPRVAPPPLHDDPETYGGVEKGGYGHGHGHGEEEDELLAGSSGASSASSPLRYRGGQKPRKNPFGVLLRLIGGTFLFVLFLILLSRLSFLPSPSASHRAKVAHHLTPYMPQSVLAFIKPVTGPSSPHPILPLLTNARTSWSKKLTSQSSTFDRATKTYKARYGMTPPPGFDKWFAFATQGRNHSLVDEYDQLMQDLKPYRSLSPQEIRRRTAELAQVPGISIVSIRNGVAQVHSKSGKWAPALAFQQMIGAYVRDLPDMDIAVNERPEGRVLPRMQKRVSMADYGLEGMSEPAISEHSFSLIYECDADTVRSRHVGSDDYTSLERFHPRMETRWINLGILPTILPSRLCRSTTHRNGSISGNERSSRSSRKIQLEIGNDSSKTISSSVAHDTRNDFLFRPRRIFRRLRRSFPSHFTLGFLLRPTFDRLPLPSLLSLETSRLRRHPHSFPSLLVTLFRVHLRMGDAKRSNQDSFRLELGHQEIDCLLEGKSHEGSRYSSWSWSFFPETEVGKDDESSIYGGPSSSRRVR